MLTGVQVEMETVGRQGMLVLKLIMVEVVEEQELQQLTYMGQMG